MSVSVSDSRSEYNANQTSNVRKNVSVVISQPRLRIGVRSLGIDEGQDCITERKGMCTSRPVMSQNLLLGIKEGGASILESVGPVRVGSEGTNRPAHSKSEVRSPPLPEPDQHPSHFVLLASFSSLLSLLQALALVQRGA